MDIDKGTAFLRVFAHIDRDINQMNMLVFATLARRGSGYALDLAAELGLSEPHVARAVDWWTDKPRFGAAAKRRARKGPGFLTREPYLHDGRYTPRVVLTERGQAFWHAVRASPDGADLTH